MIYIKNIGTWCFKHICIIVAVIAGLWLWEQYRGYKKDSVITQVITKEKEVEKLSEIKPSGSVNIPTTIINQIHLDSSFWKHAQKGTIITGIKETPNEIDIQKVDSTGKRSEEIHKLTPGYSAYVAKDGTVTEKKASFLSQLKVYGGIEAGINQNGLTNIAPQLILVSPMGWALNGNYNIMDNSKNIGVSKLIRFKRK